MAFLISQPMSHLQVWRDYQQETYLIATKKQYGTNRTEMIVPDFVELFRERVTTPFFVFQVFCMGLMSESEYRYYSVTGGRGWDRRCVACLTKDCQLGS